MRFLGMRLLTQVLLSVCFVSLISLVFLNRCGIRSLKGETEEQILQPNSGKINNRINKITSTNYNIYWVLVKQLQITSKNNYSCYI